MSRMSSRRRAFATRAVHAGLRRPTRTYGVVVPAIHQTSTYVQPAPRRVRRGLRLLALGEPDARARSSTRSGELEGGHATAFASGMAAEHALITAVCSAGDHVVHPGRPLRRHLPARRQGAHALGPRRTRWSTRPTSTRVAAAVTPRDEAVWVETPTNPHAEGRSTSRASIARSGGALVVGRQHVRHAGQPAAAGARRRRRRALRDEVPRRALGHRRRRGRRRATRRCTSRCASCRTRSAPCPGRWTASSSTAGCARCTCGWPRTPRTRARSSTFLRERAGRQRRALARLLRDGVASATPTRTASAPRTRIFTLAESLGGVESLIEVPQAMTHSRSRARDAAVPADLVRLSCGIEAAEDLVADLAQALAG